MKVMNSRLSGYIETNLHIEEYKNEDGVYHREDGPAKIWYDENGNVNNKEYYLNDIEYTDVFKWMVATGSL